MKTDFGGWRGRTVISWLLLVVLTGASFVQGATVTGRVLEDGTEAPIKGVRVKGKTGAGAVVAVTITGTNGEYRLDLPSTEGIVLEFSSGNYLMDPTLSPAQTMPIPDVVLFRRTDDRTYFTLVANRIVRVAGGNAEEAAKRWKWYSELPIPYSAKVRIAQAVMASDKRLAEVPAYAKFKGVDVAKIDRLEKQLDDVRARPAAAAYLSSDLPTGTVNGVIDSAVKRLPAAERGRFERAVSEKRAGMK